MKTFYTVCALFLVAIITFNCSKSATKEVPTVTTSIVTSITVNSARTGGNVVTDGGDPVTAQGVCWGTTPLPNISNNKTSNGTGGGSFISYLTNLTGGTTYYVRAYATNVTGTGYGNQQTFTVPLQ